MRTFILLTSLVFLPTVGVADKIKDAIDQGIVTKEFADTLTPSDVPVKWRTIMKEQHSDRYFTKSFSRGGRKILEVMWAKDWVGPKDKMFVATVYDGEVRVAKIMRIGNRASISAGKQAKGYQLITSVADDGKVSVSLSNEKGYFEVIEVQGRETRPLDDLEYTKTALLMDQFVSPLLDAVDDRIESTGKKKDAK